MSSMMGPQWNENSHSQNAGSQGNTNENSSFDAELERFRKIRPYKIFRFHDKTIKSEFENSS